MPTQKPKKSLEEELADSELIRSLFNQNAKLHEEIDELSHKVNMLNYQQEPAKEKMLQRDAQKKVLQGKKVGATLKPLLLNVPHLFIAKSKLLRQAHMQ